MHSFKELSEKFQEYFRQFRFPTEPRSLYEPAQYFLGLGGKRVRPVLCLMGNELFNEITTDAWHASVAIELFHNFTLIHDDIMDKAPIRRGMPTIHSKFGDNTALLAGDAVFVFVYDHLNKVATNYLRRVMDIMNDTARKVCEGQQLDMDYETSDNVSIEDYLHMIELKTSVLLAASLKIGAILGGATERNQDLLYHFGRKLGIAFQVQDDYLDAFGDPAKTGKQAGGDIRSNKKTFLLIHALQNCSDLQKKELEKLMSNDDAGKLEKVLAIYHDCKADQWAVELKEKYFNAALQDLEEVAVLEKRKESLKELASFLLQREH